MQKGFVFILVLAIIIGIFAISNSGVVPVDFIFTQVMVSQAIIIFICVLLGAVIASVFGGIRQMTLKRDIRHFKEENSILQSQVYELKAKIKEQDIAIEDSKKVLSTDRLGKDYGEKDNIENSVNPVDKNNFFTR